MPPTLRTITDSCTWPDGSPRANAPYRFWLQPGDYIPGTSLPSAEIKGTTNAAGQLVAGFDSEGADIPLQLWCNTEGSMLSVYLCQLPSGETFKFSVAPGGGSLALTTARAEFVAPIPPPDTLQIYVEEHIAPVQASIDAHVARVDNPHATTAHQVGAYTQAEVDDYLSPGHIGFYTLDDFADFEAAVGAIGLADAVLVIPWGAVAEIESNPPANIRIRVEQGGMVKPIGARTVQHFEAEAFYCIDESAGTLNFARGACEVLPEWYIEDNTDCGAGLAIAIKRAATAVCLLLFRAVLYTCLSWTMPALATGEPLLWRGQGMYASEVRGPADRQFIKMGDAGARAEGIGFSGWHRVLLANSDVSIPRGFSATNCRFEDMNGGTPVDPLHVTGPIDPGSGGDYSAIANDGSVTGNQGNDCGPIRLIGCDFYGCGRGCSIAGHNYRAVLVRNCSFTDTWHGAGVKVGGNKANEDTHFTTVIGCNFKNTYSLQSGSGDGVESHAILVYGARAVLMGNTLDTVTNETAVGASSNTGCEGIYTKARWSIITGNVLVNAVGYGEAAITVKGKARASAEDEPLGYACLIAHNRIYSDAATRVNQGTFGILASREESVVKDNHIEGLPNGVFVKNRDSQVIDNLFYGLTDCCTTNNQYAAVGGGILAEGLVSNLRIRGNTFVGGWGGVSPATSRNAIRVASTTNGGAISEISILNNHCGTGTAAATARAINIDATNNPITRVFIWDNRLGVNTVGIGFTNGAAVDTVDIDRNDFTDITTTKIAGAPTNVTYGRNRGFTTESKGTATVTGANTFVTVTHNLAVTPVAQDIWVTPTDAMGNSTKYWISTVGASNFRINVSPAPGASGANFVWRAKVSV